MFIAIIITLWVMSILLIIMFFKVAKEPEGISLKNINLEAISLRDQLEKIEEEEKEFYAAIVNMDRENMIEEFWDCMQSKLGMLNKFGIGAQEIMESYQKHLVKIQNRPRGNK